VRGLEETSISTGRDGKKSKENSGAECRLIRGLRVERITWCVLTR
jgi:hypothetical protein